MQQLVLQFPAHDMADYGRWLHACLSEDLERFEVL
jgi:hypothetical protein